MWPVSKGSTFPGTGKEESFSPATASFTPQPVPSPPPLCDGSKPLHFWTPCHSHRLYQAQQCAVPSAGTVPWPCVPACTLHRWWHVGPLGWQPVRTGQGGVSPAEPAGARTASAIWAITSGETPFPSCESRRSTPGPAVPGECLWGHGRVEEGAPHPKEPVLVCVLSGAQSSV